MIVRPSPSARAIRFSRVISFPLAAPGTMRAMGTSSTSDVQSPSPTTERDVTTQALYRPESEVLLASSFGSQHIWKQRLEDRGLTVRLPGEDVRKVEH